MSIGALLLENATTTFEARPSCKSVSAGKGPLPLHHLCSVVVWRSDVNYKRQITPILAAGRTSTASREPPTRTEKGTRHGTNAAPKTACVA